MAIVKRIASEEYADEKALYEALKAVENIPQSDWEQNDETALDYIKNRPFYEKTGVTSIVLFDGDAQFAEDIPEMVMGWYDEPKEFENGKTYTITIENEQQDILCENNELIFVSSELNMTFRLGEADIYIENYDSWESSYHIKIETTEVSTALKQLDEKFIPDTIARVEDIPSEEYINSLIDAKLAAIPDASEVA